MDFALVTCYSLLLKMAIEIVIFPIQTADFPQLCQRIPDVTWIGVNSLSIAPQSMILVCFDYDLWGQFVFGW